MSSSTDLHSPDGITADPLPWASSTAAPAAQEVWDVAVVGAGPAGATAAIHLTAAGHRVLLLDRRDFPRDKTCGDGLLPDAVRCLRRAGVWPRVEPLAHRVPAARFYSPSRIAVEFPGEFYTIERRVLDEILVREAVRRGATLRRAHVVGLTAADAAACLRLADGEEIRAALVLVATGADVSLLQPLGMVDRAEPSAFAVRRYLRSPVPLDRLVFSFDRATLPGYGWIFPLGDGRFNIGVGLFGRRGEHAPNPRELFARFIRESPIAREVVGEGEFETPLRGARLRCGLAGVRPVGAGPVLAIGETLGATFPFSGEGIGKAMETAEFAARTVDRALRLRGRAELHSFAAELARLRPRYRGYEIAERWFSHRWLVDLLARRARRSVFMREAVAAIVAETEQPTVIFSARGLLRSFLT